MAIQPYIENCIGCKEQYLKIDRRIRYCSIQCAVKYNGSTFTKGHKVNLGRIQTEETKEKISEILKSKGHKPPNGIRASGDKHGNWKGGISSKDYLERRRFQQTIQKEVLDRDDYTCQICHVEGGKLQVDHIQSWSEYIELRFSIDNCRTVCMSCHYKLTFGKEMPMNVKAWGHNLNRRLSSL